MQDDEFRDFIDDEDASDIHEDEDDIIKTEGGIHSDDDEKKQRSGYFQTVLDKMKSRKKRKRQLSDAECIEYCQKIICDMNTAADADEKVISEGKPALAKLDMLDFVTSEMGKLKWKYWFIQEGCCSVLCRWLSPLKDSSLPNLSIRTRLLQLLQKLPVSSQELCGNDLGRVLIHMWKHPQETDENRAVIRSLIQQWIRPLLGVGSNYKEYRQQKDHENSMAKQNDFNETAATNTTTNNNNNSANNANNSNKASKSTGVIINHEDPEMAKRKHARVPFNIGYKFKVTPKSAINKNEIASRNPRDNPTAIGKMKKMLDGRNQKIQKQAHKVSIGGRGMY